MIGYVLQQIGNWGVAMVKKKYEKGREIGETDMKIFYYSKSMIESAKCVEFLGMSKGCSVSNGKLENSLGNALFNLALVRLSRGKRALQYLEA
jgi:hypothetical protein